MVRISRQRLVQSRRSGRTTTVSRSSKSKKKNPWPHEAALVVVGLVVVWGTYFAWLSGRESKNTSTAATATTQTHLAQSAQQQQQSLRVGQGGVQPPEGQAHVLSRAFLQEDGLVEFYDALAADVQTFWDCPTLLQDTKFPSTGRIGDDDGDINMIQPPDVQQQQAPQRHRRLQQDPLPAELTLGKLDDENQAWPDDDFLRGPNDDMAITPTAAHLFCVAATPPSTNDNTQYWQQHINCPVTTQPRTRRALLDIWNAARSHVTDDALLRQFVTLAVEQPYTLLGAHEFQFWDTITDQGLNYMVKTISNDTHPTVDDGGLWGLDKNLGPGRVLVDVGSGLGTTSLAISILYPGTRIVSIEAAAPNWLYQHLNWECNQEVLIAASPTQTPPDVTLLLAGVGPDAKEPTAGHYLWKPSLTTATRSWGPASERMPDDIVIPVHLEAWHSLLAQAQVQHVDVLNIDCGACEYNFVPALTDAEFQAIATVMGNLHWGYIPQSRLPSSDRGRKTHARLCQHENLAKTAKECCDVPDLPVISSFPNQVLEEEDDALGGGGVPRPATVRDVAGSFCDDFTTWAASKYLHDVPNDAGWFQLLSPVAEGY